MVASTICRRAVFITTIMLSTGIMAYSQNDTCRLSSYVTFVGRSYTLSKIAKDSLLLIANRIKVNPECRVVVRGYCSSNKASQQLSWDRVNVVVNHLIDKEGISAHRLIFRYGEPEGNCNTVDIVAAKPDEYGPTSAPPPFPNLRRRGK